MVGFPSPFRIREQAQQVQISNLDELSLELNEVVVEVALVLKKTEDTSFGVTGISSLLGLSSSELITVEEEIEQVVVEQVEEE